MLRLDQKLANIRAGTFRAVDFIIADAKDGDMGSGVTYTGFDHTLPSRPRRRSRQEFIAHTEEIIRQDIVDVMLVSASNLELLQAGGAFDRSSVKPAIRANDTTDIWGGIRHGVYASLPSRPFRTLRFHRPTGTDLGLYSITFLNDRDADSAALETFALFRAEAAAAGFKYFYEVFNPNVTELDPQKAGEFVNDCILRSLAGVTKADRPQFLKMTFNGPRALEELASFDSDLIVGVLGGAAGTTRDTFELIAQAQRFGGRVALFGRKILVAEAPLELIRVMRAVADGDLTPREAVRVYHEALKSAKIAPVRNFEDDCRITEYALFSGALDQAA